MYILRKELSFSGLTNRPSSFPPSGSFDFDFQEEPTMNAEEAASGRLWHADILTGSNVHHCINPPLSQLQQDVQHQTI